MAACGVGVFIDVVPYRAVNTLKFCLVFRSGLEGSSISAP